jgi:salicylate hydroxylase
MILKRDMLSAYMIAVPDGPVQERRDDTMKANTAKGLDAFVGIGDFGTHELDTIRVTLSYDPEDDADNWWIKWGVLRERAKEIAEEAASGSGGSGEDTSLPSPRPV